MTIEEQINCLTKAVSLIAYGINRGPMWGTTGSAKEAIKDAHDLISQVQLAQQPTTTPASKA
jgi:hypothetical protein